MHRNTLPLTALPAWSKLNGVSYINTTTQDLGTSKRFGLVTERSMSSKDTVEEPILMIIPHDLILSTQAIEEYAKVDQHLKELLEVAGGNGSRRDIMLFLLMQITCHPDGRSVGVKNPWTEYTKFLPNHVPLPTLWSQEEAMLLTGTSLQSALAAKELAITREFEELQEKTSEILWCQNFCWNSQAVTIEDWALIDAWVRSRTFGLPNCGDSMIPCLEMANHSANANAYYKQSSSDNSVTLFLKRNIELNKASEITVSYGDTKSNAEMLWSYGFIDESSNNSPSLVLPIDPMPKDPLAKAKLVAFGGQAVIRITANQDGLTWESPFLYLASLNQEDGLEFKVLNSGPPRSRLRVFWCGKDVTEATNTFETLIDDHELKDIFKLRVATLLEDLIQQQLIRLDESDEAAKSFSSMVDIDPAVEKNALQLRASETLILKTASDFVRTQKNELLEREVVQRYLGITGVLGRSEQAFSNDNEVIDDDFS